MWHAGLRPIPDKACSQLSGFWYFALETNFAFATGVVAAFLAAFAAALGATFTAALFRTVPRAFQRQSSPHGHDGWSN